MNESAPLLTTRALSTHTIANGRPGGMARGDHAWCSWSSSTTVKTKFSLLFLLCSSFIILAVVFQTKDSGTATVTLSSSNKDLPLLEKSHHVQQEPHDGDLPDDPDVSPDENTKHHVIPPPSQQEWCMPTGKYDFFGTYRSPHQSAEAGLFFAPGRFQGTILTGQDDDTVYFHLVNVTYGNRFSPNMHVPNDKNTAANMEKDVFDAYCTIHSSARGSLGEKLVSGCYVPKYFDKGQRHTQCAKLEFPSMTGFALCRELAMAQFQYQGTTVLGVNAKTEEWTVRLSETSDHPNEYNGELRLYLQNADAEGKWKVPVTHWLSSDDQSLETSFQISNAQSWDPSTVPEIPDGCSNAIDLAKHGTMKHPSSWNLHYVGGCPFAHMHRYLLLPARTNHF